MGIVGVDEAGRGALVGPVVAAAVYWHSEITHPFLKDSKQLLPYQRDVVWDWLIAEKIPIAIGVVNHLKIDQINILQATMLAMKRSILQLESVLNHSLASETILIDGNRTPQMPGYSLTAIIKGDQTEMAISAASIVAKVTRDRWMTELATHFPAYGFEAHKGYGTESHYNVIWESGLTPFHRKTFNYNRQERLF